MFQQGINEKIEKFSSLSDMDCAFILQNHFIEALKNEDSYFEWELVSKIMTIGYELREPLTDLFRNASGRNMQIIANAPVSNWIREYNLKFPLMARNPDSFFEFATHDPKAGNMSDTDRILLMRILRIYDYLLLSPPFDMEETSVSALLKYRLSPEKSLLEIKKEILNSLNDNSEDKTTTLRTVSVKKIGIKSVLQQYPKIGEQGITSSPLRIKSFDRPVRPSIKNWIYDYTSILGQGHHDSMQRTNYLFRSENAKNLSSTEREKLGIILKSFDENTPLPIDTENNEVVFDINDQRSMINDQYKRIAPAQKKEAPQKKLSQETFIRPYPAPAKPVLSKARLFPSSEQVAGIPQSQAFPVENSFVRPYQAPEARPTVPPKPVDQSSLSKARLFPSSEQVAGIPQSQALGSSKPSFIQFVNPYPAPETHKMAETEAEMAGEAPVKLKGFSEGVSKEIVSKSSAPSRPIDQSSAFPSSSKVRPASQGSTFPLSDKSSNSSMSNLTPPKPYVPSHPKNVIYPHYRSPKEEESEPRIDGNIVDLSNQ